MCGSTTCKFSLHSSWIITARSQTCTPRTWELYHEDNKRLSCLLTHGHHGELAERRLTAQFEQFVTPVPHSPSVGLRFAQVRAASQVYKKLPGSDPADCMVQGNDVTTWLQRRNGGGWRLVEFFSQQLATKAHLFKQLLAVFETAHN